MPYPNNESHSGQVESVHFTSGGSKIVGILYKALEAGPRPAAILLHGIPGSEKNLDVAYRLRDLGWHSLIVHFRGAWGSGGDYDMTRQPDDAIAAIDYVAVLNPSKIVLIGYSLGSRAAIVAAYRDQRVGAVVSIAGIADFEELMLDPQFYEDAAPMLHNATAKALSGQWMQLGGDENPIGLVGKLSQPLLIVHGTEDQTVPYYMAPALAKAGGELITIEGADHVFSRHRAQLVTVITNWLEGWAKQ